MNREALEQLRCVIEAVPADRLDMDHWTCGTRMCAGGWAASTPWFIERGLHLENGTPVYDGLWEGRALRKFFDLGPGQAEDLFGADGLFGDAARVSVLIGIDRLLALPQA